jgi:hypothetical protein
MHALERNALRAGVLHSFVIAHSHYRDSIDLDTVSLDYAPGYEGKELEEIEMVVAPIVQDLSSRIEDVVLPRRG